MGDGLLIAAILLVLAFGIVASYMWTKKGGEK